MKIHCLQHLENETLGNIGVWITHKGHILTKTLLYEKPSFPDPSEFDLLLVMGGKMSVYQEEEFLWLKPEKEFIRKTIKASKPILGSCFGAQITAEILGGRVTKNRFKEIGWHTVRSIRSTNLNASINLDLPYCRLNSFPGFMWHGDTFEIPPDAIKLFESEACPNQGFIYNGNVVGLQFHPEADKQWVKNLLSDSRNELVPEKYIQSEKEIYEQEEYFKSAGSLAFSLMDWFEKNLKDNLNTINEMT